MIEPRESPLLTDLYQLTMLQAYFAQGMKMYADLLGLSDPQSQQPAGTPAQNQLENITELYKLLR